MAEENDKIKGKENKEKLSLSTIAVDEQKNVVKRADVLLDGGARHHV